MSESLLFDEKFNQKTRRRNHIPKLLRFNDWVCFFMGRADFSYTLDSAEETPSFGTQAQTV